MWKQAKPFLGVVLLQFGYAGLGILAKFALNRGMNHYSFAVYRNVTAAAVFAPFAIVLERKVRPRMTAPIFFNIMLLGLLEPVIDQNLYYAGMKYTSATFPAAMTNTVPAITFIMAWILRIEKVRMRSLQSQAKVAGTLITACGAMIMTLIKGSAVGLPWTKQHAIQAQNQSAGNQDQDHMKGSLMISAGCFCWASFYILQATTLETYNAELSLTTLICAVGALQGTILALVVERKNPAIWSIHFDAEFLAVIYSGIICSGVGYSVSGMIMKQKGPVFVAAFNPLSMVIVAILSSFFLAEQTFLGRMVGAAVIVVGLYLVIWGKSKDQNSTTSEESLGSDDQEEKTTKHGGRRSSNEHDFPNNHVLGARDESV